MASLVVSKRVKICRKTLPPAPGGMTFEENDKTKISK